MGKVDRLPLRSDFFRGSSPEFHEKKDRLAGLDKADLPVVKWLCELDFAKQSLMS